MSQQLPRPLRRPVLDTYIHIYPHVPGLPNYYWDIVTVGSEFNALNNIARIWKSKFVCEHCPLGSAAHETYVIAVTSYTCMLPLIEQY